jgi:CSLREA domain-containing protein
MKQQMGIGRVSTCVRRTTLAIAAAALAILGGSADARATTISVTTTLDDTTPGNCSLREAVIAANTNLAVDACPAGEAGPASVDVIELGAGVHVLAIAGANENAAATGDLDVTDDATIVGQGSSQTVIDAQDIDRVLHLLGADLTVQDLTLQNGNNGGPGGGIRNEAGTLEIIDVVIRDSRAAGAVGNFDGGGIANGAGGAVAGNVTVRDSTIQDNESTDAGGGLFNGLDGIMDVIGSTITRNSGPDSGGGIRNERGMVTVTDSLIVDNHTDDDGGGIRNNYGTVVVTGSTISDNTAADGGGSKTNQGAGIHNKDGGSLTVIDTTVRDNVAEEDGGGLRNDDGQVDIVGSTFSGNQSPATGGIRNNDTMTVTNSTVSGNSGSTGAGLLNAPGATLELSNVTLTDNSATTGGGGIRNAGTVTLRNTIAAGNSAPSRADCSNSNIGVFVSEGYNLFGDGTGCLSIASDQLVAPASVSTNVLGALQDNGGQTHTHGLLAGSPALDTGDPSGCVDDLAALLTSDQRGLVRPQDALGGGLRCDVGAYEQQPTTTSTTSPPTTSTTSPPTTSTTAAPTTTTTIPPVVKVTLCHIQGPKKGPRRNGPPRTKTISIESLSVANHLAHGDKLGVCPIM